MCVAAIIHKPLSQKHLQCMDDDNPHGGGVAWRGEDGALHFHRGLDAAQIYALQECGLITLPYLLHFRWATHGSRTAQLTHPFPTGERAFDGELRGVADEVLIHNGIWHDYGEWVGMVEGVPEKKLEDISDTAVAAYFYAWFPELGDEIPWAVASARIAADGSLAITKHGGWSEHEGNEFSNLSWLPASEWATSGRYGTAWARRASGGWTWEDAANYDTGGYRYTPPTSDHYEDGWEDYVRWRYGNETADAVKEAGADNEDDAVVMAKLAALEEIELLTGGDNDDDLVSDDPAEVNRWLGRKTAQSYLAKEATSNEVVNWTHYAKCKMCEVFTKAQDGVCGYCAAQLLKESAA